MQPDLAGTHDNPLAETLQPLYSKNPDVGSVLYNDEWPNGTTSFHLAHAKGVHAACTESHVTHQDGSARMGLEFSRVHAVQVCWDFHQREAFGWCTAHQDGQTAPMQATTLVGDVLLCFLQLINMPKGA